MFFNGKKHTWYHHIKITFLCFKSGKKTSKELSCERILPKFQSIGRPLKREEQRFLEKSARPPSSKSPLKLQCHLPAVGYLGPNCQGGNENLSRWRERQHFCLSAFSKAELSFPILFQFPISGKSSLHRCQYRGRVHCAVANIAEEFIAM